MIGEEIVLEIDKTLDQLIRNAEVISKVEMEALSDNELDAFQKTQESLLQHLMTMDEALSVKISAKFPPVKLQQKLLHFEKLKIRYNQTIERHQNRPILAKRRSKRFIDLRARKQCSKI